MSDKQPMQAAGGDGAKGAPDGVNVTHDKTGGSESSGGHYPNSHDHQKEKTGGFFGHGGQTEIAYSGTGQGGHDDDPEVGNANAVTK